MIKEQAEMGFERRSKGTVGMGRTGKAAFVDFNSFPPDPTSFFA
jgi:hypothetical protein